MCQYFCCQSRACSVCCTVWCIFGFLITGFFSILSDSDKVYALVGVTGTNNTDDAVGAFAGSGTCFLRLCDQWLLSWVLPAHSRAVSKAVWCLGAGTPSTLVLTHLTICGRFFFLRFPAAIYAVCSIGCGICWIYHDFIKKKKLVKRKYTTEVRFVFLAPCSLRPCLQRNFGLAVSFAPKCKRHASLYRCAGHCRHTKWSCRRTCSPPVRMQNRKRVTPSSFRLRAPRLSPYHTTAFHRVFASDLL